MYLILSKMTNLHFGTNQLFPLLRYMTGGIVCIATIIPPAEIEVCYIPENTTSSDGDLPIIKIFK